MRVLNLINSGHIMETSEERVVNLASMRRRFDATNSKANVQ